MFWGQFINTEKARDEYNCSLQDCDNIILPGEECFGLVVRNRKGTLFTRRFHEACYFPYIHSTIAERKKAMQAGRAQARPARNFQLETDQMRRRQTLLQYISQQRNRLLVGYALHKEPMVVKAKANILRHLEELDGLGPVHKFKFGDALYEILAKGADPLISEQDARQSDEEKGQARAIELLNPVRPAYSELDDDMEHAEVLVKQAERAAKAAELDKMLSEG